MTCQECELALASEDQVDVSDHLAACAACSELAMELRANSQALREFANEPMPMVARPRPVRWQWAAVAAIAAAAAMIAMVLFSPKPAAVVPPVIHDVAAMRSVDPVMPVVERAPLRSRLKTPRKAREQEVLQVKMLTSDPDVVIYWQVSN